MDTAHWNRVKGLFERALEKPQENRLEFLREQCAEDSATFAEVSDLLSADERPHSILEGPAVDALDLPDGFLAEGTQIGVYKIVRRIGQGGMGAVYLAERADGHFKQQVALKIIKRGMDSAEILKRFEAERQILAHLHHPNIARLLDGGLTDDGLPYFTMEYVDGQPIHEYCDTHRLSVTERLRIFQTVLSAVQYAHQNLVVHRDLKPGNLLVTDDGTIKLVDFGIAKVVGGDSDFDVLTALTQTGMRAMTPGYASPEQVRGEPVTTASDVYSLGVVLFELLTGKSPYLNTGGSLKKLEEAICDTAPDKPSRALSRVEKADTVTLATISHLRDDEPRRLRKTLAGDLDTICLKALRKEPERRYQSVEQLADDIERYLSARPILARPDSFSYRAGKFVKRNVVAVSASVLVVTGIVTLVAFYTSRLERERDNAQQEAEKAKQVTALLTSFFEEADPNLSKGEEITAREMLDQATERIEDELADQPEIQGEMLNVIGNVYIKLGDYDVAIAILQRALNVQETTHGRRSAEVALTLHDLGTIYYNLGMYDSCEFYYQQSADIDKQLFGENSRPYAIDVSDIAVAIRMQGDFKRAEPMFRQALKLKSELFGEHDVEVAHTLNHLGRLLTFLGKYDEAEPLLRRGLKIRLDSYGPEHVEVVASRGALAGLLGNEKKYPEAYELYLQNLKTLRKLMGDEHHYVGATMGSLAAIEYRSGAYPAADTLYQEALRILRKNLDASNPNLSYSLDGLGLTYLKQGFTTKADSLLRLSLKLREDAFTRDHWLTAISEGSLGELLTVTGKYASAEELLLHSLAVLAKKYSEDNSRIQQTYQRLADLYLAQGDSSRAELYLAKLTSN